MDTKTEKSKQAYMVQINAVEDVEEADCTLENLKIMYSTGSAIAKGFGEKRHVTCRSGFATKLGNIELDCWIALATRAVTTALGEVFLHHMTDFIKSRPNCSAKNATQMALAACIAGDYNNPDWKMYPSYLKYCKDHPVETA